MKDARGYLLTKWKNICTISSDRGQLRLFDTRLKPCKRLSGRKAKIRLSMNLDEAVDEALATYNMSRSQEAEETGRAVATLQD